MSEETTAFVADVYVDGAKTAYAKNDGHGGSTDYNAYEGKREILKKAEQHCLSLPAKDYEDFTVPMNLEHFIDNLITEELNNKDKKKFEKLMETSILVGVPNGTTYGRYNLKKILSSIPREQLQRFIDKCKSQLKQGEVILNTNLESLGITI